MGFTITPLPSQDEFGAVVTGVTLETLDDQAARKALHDLWIDKGVIVFRGMEGLDIHLGLSRVFGECEVHPLLRGVEHPREHDLIIEIEYDEEQGDIYQTDGEARGAFLPWHSDLVYVEEINHGGILRPVTLPARGGETGFIDQIAAYGSLPQSLKDRIEGLNVCYHYNVNAAQMMYGPKPEKIIRQGAKIAKAAMHSVVKQRAIHPLVYVQKDSGRKVLNVSPWFCEDIEGMSREESAPILAEVMSYATNPARSYFHKWEMGDMVLWDNWRMIHCCTGVPLGEKRHMRRTTIAGDYGLGRFEQAGATVTDEMRVGV
jgi:taurine dioxygenase